MQRFYRVAYFLSVCAATVAAAALVLMVAMIIYEIALRYFFSTSTFVLGEFVGYGVSICVLWSLGYTLEHNGLIRVNLLMQSLRPGWQRGLEVCAALATAAMTFGLALEFLKRAMRAWSRGTVSASLAEVPIWIPEGVVLVGLSLFTLQLVAHALRVAAGHPSPARIDPHVLTE
ncbi:TRAP transporter small permease subunit [Nitratireductor sp. ZSWI3]|uniref:TRAP transporter small permease subunit n=1 Tax=Nitratireductor sp. ZSWI3 TaxID=2966359 RepID=UPI00214F79B7|nr:TRAP transporter small permease [Nitratireductor sp. ZSWI3]MCR4265566.1 TRAP transporter small permease [Nitratireductor sp. ZSWI3]